MSMIDDIKRDREAGTDGPWVVRTLENFGWNICHYLGGDKFDIFRIGKVGDQANAHRIARVPDMEAALIIAEEMANGSEGNIESDGVVYAQIPVALIDAFRAATGAA